MPVPVPIESIRFQFQFPSSLVGSSFSFLRVWSVPVSIPISSTGFGFPKPIKTETGASLLLSHAWTTLNGEEYQKKHSTAVEDRKKILQHSPRLEFLRQREVAPNIDVRKKMMRWTRSSETLSFASLEGGTFMNTPDFEVALCEDGSF